MVCMVADLPALGGSRDRSRVQIQLRPGSTDMCWGWRRGISVHRALRGFPDATPAQDRPEWVWLAPALGCAPSRWLSLSTVAGGPCPHPASLRTLYFLVQSDSPLGRHCFLHRAHCFLSRKGRLQWRKGVEDLGLHCVLGVGAAWPRAMERERLCWAPHLQQPQCGWGSKDWHSLVWMTGSGGWIPVWVQPEAEPQKLHEQRVRRASLCLERLGRSKGLGKVNRQAGVSIQAWAQPWNLFPLEGGLQFPCPAQLAQLAQMGSTHSRWTGQGLSWEPGADAPEHNGHSTAPHPPTPRAPSSQDGRRRRPPSEPGLHDVGRRSYLWKKKHHRLGDRPSDPQLYPQLDPKAIIKSSGGKDYSRGGAAPPTPWGWR